MSIKLREVNVKYKTTSEGHAHKIESPEDALKVYRTIIEDDAQEQVMLILLDITNTVIGYSVIGKGSDCESTCSVRMAMQKALLVAASRLVLLHNHPSGITTASEEDITLTERFVIASDLLEMEVLDHIIVGYDTYNSLKISHSKIFASNADLLEI